MTELSAKRPSRPGRWQQRTDDTLQQRQRWRIKRPVFDIHIRWVLYINASAAVRAGRYLAIGTTETLGTIDHGNLPLRVNKKLHRIRAMQLGQLFSVPARSETSLSL